MCARNKCLISHIVLSWKLYTYQSRHRRLDIQYNSDFLPSRQIFSSKAKCRWPLLNHHRYYDRDHDYERSCNCDLDRDRDRKRDRDRERKCQCKCDVFWLLSLYSAIIRLCKEKILNFLLKGWKLSNLSNHLALQVRTDISGKQRLVVSSLILMGALKANLSPYHIRGWWEANVLH